MDSIAIRSICHISLGYDHRVIDGAIGDQFLREISHYLQNWNEDFGLIRLPVFVARLPQRQTGNGQRKWVTLAWATSRPNASWSCRAGSVSA